MNWSMGAHSSERFFELVFALVEIADTRPCALIQQGACSDEYGI